MTLIIFLILICLLQIFLSKNKNKYLGLILPSISILYSILMILSYAMFDNESILSMIFQLIIIFIVGNIPTFILLGIYFSYRKNLSKNSEIDKMNIKDL